MSNNRTSEVIIRRRKTLIVEIAIPVLNVLSPRTNLCNQECIAIQKLQEISTLNEEYAGKCIGTISF